MSELVQYDIILSQQHGVVGGIDEAGRGPLAGPVVVAGVIMPLDNILEGVNDSKKVTEKRRLALYDKILSTAISYHVAVIDNKTIDDINILNATKQGMLQCVESLSVVNLILIDAVKLDTNVATMSIIKGDATSYNIACASILAKVTRDRIMLEMDKVYPQYNFAQHKGYGTAKHIEALRQYGKCEIHRDTFIRNFVK